MAIHPNFRVPGHLLRRAFQAHDAVFARETAGFDITSPQVATLVAISLYPGIEINPLTDLVGYDGATLNGLVNRLVVKKLVRRVIAKDDRRRRRLFLTVKGRGTLDEIMPRGTRVGEILLEPLQPKEREQLLDFLERIIVHASSFRPRRDESIA
jgi:DNA-binding MarR family transcriptional regulator